LRLKQLSHEIGFRLNDIWLSRRKRSDPTLISAQTEKDKESLATRKMALGSQFGAMKDFLKGKTKGELLFSARLLRKERNLQKVDRAEKRHRDALVCWYCESCPDVLNADSVLLDILAQYQGAFSDVQAHTGTISKLISTSLPISTLFQSSDEQVSEMGCDLELLERSELVNHIHTKQISFF
jgi:hypothetical protein